MNNNFNYLFYFLDKEQISIDKTEFLFQIQSHPDYPSLLSISDTLAFFNIDNAAIRVDFTDLELLPNRFVALFNKPHNKPELCFIEKKDNKFFITEDKLTYEISIADIETKWTGVVLLIEKSELESSKNSKNKFYWILPLLCLLVFLLILIRTDINIFSNLFFLFPVLGLLFSVAALKDLFGTKSELISNFCNFSASTSCESIVGSDKWKIFSYINFSDLAVVFFSTQFLGLFVFLISGNYLDYFAIQSILLFGSIPVMLLSLYFQKFVEKKWCPICLVIISIIVLEIIYLTSFFETNFKFTLNSLLLFGLVFLFVTLVWTTLKKLLTNHKKLKEDQLKANRFLRNYEIFKNTLISKPKAELPVTPIVLGNKESKTVITIITSPFCSYCKEAHEITERILDKYHDDLQIRLIINVDLNQYDDERKLFFRSLLHIYLNENEDSFRLKMNNWYENKNVSNWLANNKLQAFDYSKIDAIYNSQNNHCKNNGYSYTPAIFINGFEYPKLYERPNLEFFINELIEDDNF
jgi:glutaredoxin/uncharacterized membrane protein